MDCALHGTAGMDSQALRTIVMALSGVYLAAMMLGLGLELGGGPKESKEEKRSKRRGIVVGQLLNLVLLPLVAFGVTRALRTSGAVSVALLLLAAAPGGRFGPHAVKLGKGDVALSAEVTMLLAKATCITAVPTAKWLLTLRTLEIHELPFLLQLVVLQLVPFYFGKWYRAKRPEKAARLRRPVEAVALGSAVLVLAFAVAHTERWLEVLDPRSWLAVACVGVISPLLGWLVGGRRRGSRRAFAIGANAREIGVAIAMATFAFPRADVRTALFGVALVYTVSCFMLASVLRIPGGRRPGAAGSAAPRPLSA